MRDASAPRWAGLSGLGLSLAGLAVSAYLTVEHATAGRSLACPETGVVNCATVLSSPQAVVLGVPVAVFGLVYFVAMVALTAPPVWRRANPILDRLRVGLAVLGVLSVCYLLYVELFVVDAICLWCTVVHVLTVALFGVLVMDLAGRPDRISTR
jgi:uncharacterized membrane protein